MNKPYKNISDTNTAFGNAFGSCIRGGIITNYEKLQNQSANLYDELDELRDDGFELLKKDKFSKQGRQGMVDAIADLLVFLYGVPHFLGVNYVEKTANTIMIEGFGDLPADEFYTTIYDDIKTLIDNLMTDIKNHSDEKVILKHVEELDVYLMSLCGFYKTDVDLLIQKVTDSNMSKLCLDQVDTEATLNFYRDKGVDVYSKESPLFQENGSPYYVVYSSKEQEVQGKVYRAHKFLKCVNWFEPDLSDI